MDNSVFAATVAWVIAHGYALMFILMLIEGPAVTAAGAFAAVLGYFNIWTVFTLSVLGNLIPDAAYYAIGFWGRQRLIDKYGRYFKITPEKVARLEELYRAHVGKTIAVVKLISVLATPGLIIAGISRVPLKKYVCWSLAVTLPTSGFYLILGYFFGSAYAGISRYEHYGEYLIWGTAAIIAVIYFIRKKFFGKLAERIEKI